MKKHLFSRICCILVLFGSAVPTMAQDEFEKVEVLDHPRYTLNDRFVLDLEISFLPLDAYYKPLNVETALSYQFTDFFTWEGVRVGYSLTNIDTGLKTAIERDNPGSAVTSALELGDFRYKVGTAGYVNLLYSKSNLFNRSIIYHYWQVGLGTTYYDFTDTSQVTADVNVRVRFFLTDYLTANVRVGQSFGFKSGAPKSITNVGLGVGFAF